MARQQYHPADSCCISILLFIESLPGTSSIQANVACLCYCLIAVKQLSATPVCGVQGPNLLMQYYMLMARLQFCACLLRSLPMTKSCTSGQGVVSTVGVCSR